MKQLWTPWRMEHVLGSDEPAGSQSEVPCLFEPPGTGCWSRDSLLLYRDAGGVCLLNRFPYANGHLLIAPRRHVGDLESLSRSERAALMELVNDATAIVRHVMNPDGFNIGINVGVDAGAGIPDHLHVHVVPRWRGDHNYITVIGELRTIPEHINATFDRLLPSFQQLLDAHTS